jgi:Lon protease-like protein
LLTDPQNLHTSVALESFVKNNFPVEYAQKVQDHRETLKFCDDRMPLLLVNSYAPFPQEEIAIHITEPRYILLVQRVLSNTTKEFCIIPYSQTPKGFIMHNTGSKVELVHSKALENGYEIHIRGISSVEVEDKVLADGYWHGKVKEYRDIAPTSNITLCHTKQNIHGIIERFKYLQKLYTHTNNPNLPQTTKTLFESDLPNSSTPEEWSTLCYYIGSLLPLTIKWRLELMKCERVYDRTQMLLHVLNRELI